MLIQYRRHAITGKRRCKKGHDQYQRDKKDCDCMVYVEGRPSKDAPYIKTSTGTRSWSKACKMVVAAEERGSWLAPIQVETPQGVVEIPADGRAISNAIDAFLHDVQSPQGRNVVGDTYNKYKVLLTRLKQFCAERGLVTLDQLTVEECRTFRNTWPNGPKATANNLIRLRTFFRFCCGNRWIVFNPAAEIKAPKLVNIQKEPFENEDVEAMLRAAASLRWKGMPASESVAFILTLRYSGLRISDASRLRLDSLRDGHLYVWMQKLQEWVSIPLPVFVVKALKAVRPKQGKYFFCAGSDVLGTVTGLWRTKLKRVYKKAGVVGAHPHRFRHTFAARLLAAGIDVKEVSVLLGHASVSVTEKHYSKWIKARQDRLTANVMAVYDQSKASVA